MLTGERPVVCFTVGLQDVKDKAQHNNTTRTKYYIFGLWAVAIYGVVGTFLFCFFGTDFPS